MVQGSHTGQHAPTASGRAMGRNLARSKQLHTMSNHTKNDIRAHTDRNTIANDPGNLHAMSNHTKNDIRAHTDRNTIANDPGNLHAMSNNTPPQGEPLPLLGCASAYPLLSPAYLSTQSSYSVRRLCVIF